MPDLDRSGPERKGARTGRGMGRCNSNKRMDSETEFKDETIEGGKGQGFGFGRGGAGRLRLRRRKISD
ncbi:hypothetical protein BZG01_07120 [Labilibaculum manganireducens]|uniref:Uncharacterized protein n=1 Tax=Labilibaculum manganireducens TaxID=1940525 RepID=A0A2N3IB63_9BACT|nr:DUF5320 domain-containing protein [Labilibaculum manganireducens]PKQ67503.1 hypothetical protein BZG01_07120 [Labilibaculum manganireducens]